jgi:hypothetical protein
MNLFKKALVATAVVAAFSANAAVIVSPTTKISQEGYDALQAALTAPAVASVAADVTLSISVDNLTASNSVITLSFPESDLSGINYALGVVSDDTPSAAEGQAGDITFNYGNGVFTFNDVNVDAAAKTIEFKVSTGNPIAAGSAFDVTIANFPLSGVATVSYKSENADQSVVIETSPAKAFSEFKDQFSYEVTESFNAKIEREDKKTFINGDTADTFEVRLTNDESLAAAITGVNGTIVLEGDFALNTNAEYTAASSPGTVAVSTSTGGTGVDTITQTFASGGGAGALKQDGTDSDFAITFTPLLVSPYVISETGAVTYSINLAGTDATATGGQPWTDTYVEDAAGAGEWVLDATTISVAYFPVGGSVSSFVHFANSSDVDVSIQVEGYDSDLNTAAFAAVDLLDANDATIVLKANAVTKISAGAIMKAFNLNSVYTTKLALTFKLGAQNDDNVKAQAVTTSDDGRTELATSQQLNEPQ